MSEPTVGRPSIRFRGRNFLALVVAPDPPLNAWLGDLDDWLVRAPAFFRGRPVVLDLSSLALTPDQTAGLVAELGRRGIKVMGVDGADVEWLGIGVPHNLMGGKPEPSSDLSISSRRPEQTNGSAPEEGQSTSLVVEEPVRSGRSIYFPGGDVSVIGSVQSGAEVIAGGTITVHGALRGRAIAGVAGHPKARIFCRRFEAELLAIDGVYRAAESVDAALWGKPVQARLEGDTLVIEPLE